MNHPDARRRAREHLKVDTTLSPAERETTLRFAEAGDTAHFYTTERGLMNRILAHPVATVEHLNVLAEPGARAAEPVPLGEYDDGLVAGVEATLPVGLLKIQRRARSTTAHADVVSEAVLEAARTDGGEELEPPDTTTVARRLDADPERLQRFVRHHPEPTAEHVLEAFDGGEELLGVVAEWIAAEERRRAGRRERRHDGGGRP